MLPPRIKNLEQLDSTLTTPAAGSLYEIPVVVLRFLPTSDGVTLDPAHTNLSPSTQISLATLEQKLDEYDRNTKFLLEEGSRFRGYGSQTVPPSLGYKIVASITVYEPTPPGKVTFIHNGYPSYGPEWFQIFDRFGLRNYINNLGVKEIWHWKNINDGGNPNRDPNVHLPEYFRDDWESNLSSPTTSDISNSNHDSTDLPILNHSYVVYSYHNLRTQDGAGHVHGHQLEAFLSHADWLQTGNTQMFWQKFVGRDANHNWVRGRCGDMHHPPNALYDYDYTNFTPYLSDIKDWKPDGSGQKIQFSAATYNDIPYAFPVYPPEDKIQTHWSIFWFQSMPGRNNTIPFGSNRMTNWWHFTGNWDAAIKAGIGLYEPASCSFSLSTNGQAFSSAGGTGSVNVITSANCRWFASSNATWIQITSGGTSNNGNTTVYFAVQPNTTNSPRSATIIIGGQIYTVSQGAN